MYTFSFW